MTQEFDNLMSQVSALMQDLRLGYVESQMVDLDIREPIFAASIIKSLSTHHQIIGILSKILRKDLINTIHTHHLKYINQLEAKTELASVLEEFNHCVKELKTNLSQDQNIDCQLDAKEFDKLCKFVADIIHKIQGIFAEQNHNDIDIHNILAISIALQIPQLKFADIDALASNLITIKELWVLQAKKKYIATDKKIIFLQSTKHIIDSFDTEIDSNFDIVQQIIDHLVDDQAILIELSDQELYSIYNRIKNDDVFISAAFSLIENIYLEAKIRFNCSRLSDSGYQILERFQKFEAIVQQIDDLEKSFVEKYLVSNNYLGHALVNINRHTENISALKLTNDKNFISLLTKIDSAVRSFKVKGGNPQIKTLENLHNKLDLALDINIVKKYSELDNFQVEYLKRKYSTFFENALNVVEEEGDYQDYLSVVFNRKLAYDFYLPHVNNSIDKLRVMELDRQEIKKSLNEIQLIKVFHVFSGNKIKSLDFRKKTLRKNIKKPQEYINALIKALIVECSAFQLEAIYRPLIGKNLSKTEQMLKSELSNQIRIRTSISKMLLSVMTGRKKEYKTLKELRKT